MECGHIRHHLLPVQPIYCLPYPPPPPNKGGQLFRSIGPHNMRSFYESKLCAEEVSAPGIKLLCCRKLLKGKRGVCQKSCRLVVLCCLAVETRSSQQGRTTTSPRSRSDHQSPRGSFRKYTFFAIYSEMSVSKGSHV